MARDLPFDGDEEVTERGGDTAYRIASATSRVARGGAYVTGGALIANNGGGVPAPPSELDSRNAGWAYSADPDPDVPSPVITFPDPDPVQSEAPGSAGDASTTMPLPHGPTFDIQVGRPGDFDLDDYYPGVHTEDIPGLTLVPGSPEGGAPGAEYMPGTGVPESRVCPSSARRNRVCRRTTSRVSTVSPVGGRDFRCPVTKVSVPRANSSSRHRPTPFRPISSTCPDST
jgi:hypothetical protein